MREPRSGESRSGSSFARQLSWVVAVFNLIIVALAAWTVTWSRGQYVARAEIATHNLAQILEQNLQGMVNQIDLALLAVKDEFERQDAAPPEARVEASIQAEVSRIGFLDALRTADALGFVNHGTEVIGSQRIRVQDRDYFQHLKTHAEAGLFISSPILGRHSGKWVVLFARRLNQPHGGFAGVVYGTITIDDLVHTLSKVEVGRRGSISLRGAHLELLARFPKTPGEDRLIGSTTVAGHYLEAAQSGRPESHFTEPSSLDGQWRTYTLRRMVHPSFFILVGLAQQDYLQAWRREAALSGAAVLGLLTLSLGITWLAHSAWNRQMASQTERDRLIQELTLALAEVKNLKGLLPICGQCKKIRDDQGYWTNLESFISQHSDATFSHGLCPDCAREMRDEIQSRRDQRDQEPTD